jgi:hypothetical protein
VPGLVGCSSKPHEISGTISYAGEPVPEGSIRFEPADRQSASFGGTISNGQYRVSVSSALIRSTTYVVRIDGLRKTGRQLPAGPPFAEGTLVDETAQYLPAIYNSTSTLTREITADALQQVDFDLPRQK